MDILVILKILEIFWKGLVVFEHIWWF